MPGVKTFINTTASTLQITLFTRQGDNPANADGTTSFTLTPGQTSTITYGSQQNPFLNGISLTTTSQGEVYTKTQLVTAKSSQLDNLLNTNNVITIIQFLSDYVFVGSNSTDFPG
jgi:hypothetical protein